MSDHEDKSTSLINLGSLTQPLDTATKGLIDGAGAFLSKICLPAAEEVGLLFRDRVSYWRALNLAKVLKKTESKLKGEFRNISPKLILPIVEGASLEENEELQDLWAKLLSSALDPNFKGTIRSAYTDIIKQLEVVDVHILNAIYQVYRQSIKNQEPPENSRISPQELPVYGHDIIEKFKFEPGLYESSLDNLIRVRCIASYIEEKEIRVESQGVGLLGSRASFRGVGKRHQVTFDHRYGAVSLTSLGVDFIEACTNQTPNDAPSE